MSGFALELGALASTAGGLLDESSALAAGMESITGGSVQTGDGGLDGLIRGLTDQIRIAMAGAGQALEADAGGLVQTLENYERADVVSGPLP